MRWLIFVMVLLATSAGAQIYEWFDEDGRRHFSDQKPEGYKYRVVDESRDLLTTYQSPRAPAPQRRIEPARQPAPPPGSRAREAELSRAEADAFERQCNYYLQQLEIVQAQLRAGYREPRGQHLRNERRRISTLYNRNCT